MPDSRCRVGVGLDKKIFLSHWYFFIWEFSFQIHKPIIRLYISWVLYVFWISAIHQIYSWQIFSPSLWAFSSFAWQKVLSFMGSLCQLLALTLQNTEFHWKSPFLHLYLVGLCPLFSKEFQHFIKVFDSFAVDFCSGQ